MEKSDYSKYWKLEMMAESAESVFKEEERIVVDVPSPQKHDYSTPEWLVKVMKREKGYNPKLIMTRNLFMSDLDEVQACLSMPLKQVKNSDFLTEKETRIIDEQQESKDRKGAMNEFNVNDVTEIWSFRHGGGELGFALSPLTRSGPSTSSRASSSHDHTIA
ncbi:B3 domain-containing protein [Cardamine amara subsp. amara]|uniref:B3 domain-containing protein n=1 Tax=Cardamine amara subsp. amara TaxID=228776 RepID=A0ABD0Z7L9_CARAN